VDLAVPEGILDLFVGLGDHQRAVGFRKDRCSEQLVAAGDAGLGERHDVVFDYVEQAVDQRSVRHDHSSTGSSI
jgi:hypothetical protein